MVTTLLTTHHVGGRAGTRTFPSMKYFEKDLVNVLYEADESSISGIKKETHYLPSKTIILPDCLSGSAGKRKFYIYNNRYFSSLYPLKPEQTGAYSFDSQFGWDTDPKALSIVETCFKEFNQFELHQITPIFFNPLRSSSEKPSS